MGIYGVDPGSSAQAKTFNFRVVQPDELDVESCLYLFKYLAKYCKLVLFDQKLIDICKETAQNEWIPQNKMTEEEYKKIFVSHRIVKHHANHQDHFHIRLSEILKPRALATFPSPRDPHSWRKALPEILHLWRVIQPQIQIKLQHGVTDPIHVLLALVLMESQPQETHASHPDPQPD